MRLRYSRLSRSGKSWGIPTISLTWLLTAFFLTCYASQHLLKLSLPGADATYLALSPDGVGNGFYWQFLTSAFASASLWQLSASVLLFFLCGNELEPIVGPRLFAGAFLVTQILGTAASLLMAPDGGQMGIWPGVCGLLAVLGTMLPTMEFRYRLFRKAFFVRMRLVAVLVPGALIVAILAAWIDRTSWITLPVAMLAGYLFARWMGYGLPTAPERYLHERKLQEQRWNRLAPREVIEQEVDPILEKITRDGWKGVTRREKKILLRSAEKLNR
ncbi:MAG TPA: rhomboid family intramembrane serine protease [Chthoniobacterales bacterium]|jgi:membrane associated rhomboid family serine protease